jgi:hypothetical protein
VEAHVQQQGMNRITEEDVAPERPTPSKRKTRRNLKVLEQQEEGKLYDQI